MRSRQSQRILQRLETLHGHPEFPAVVRVIQTLSDQGYLTVLAGGCVRDSLLGKISMDLDVATAAPPEVVENSFPRTLALGKAFGTIVVVEDGHNFEVTTFRKDGPYSDGRHPSHVQFTDIEEDARRRDFTVNALFYNPLNEEILDYVGGVEDLELRVLRTVGVPEERFQEDRLRMLRAARFHAQLGFELDAATLTAIQKEHGSIRIVSVERIFNELRRLLEAPYVANGLRILLSSQLSEVVWPELAQTDLEKFAGFVPTLNWENAFSAVMLLANATNSEERLRAWKVPRESLRRVQAQIEGCKILMDPKSTRAARVRILGGEDFAEVLVLVKGLLGTAPIEGWIKEYLQVTGREGKMPKPLLNGQDLLQLGVAPGEKMGLLLKALFDEQLEGRLTSKEEALQRLKTLGLEPAQRT